MFRLSCATRFCFAVGLFVTLTAASDQADAQYYRFGPRGGVSIQSPFFSLNVPPAPYYYGPGYYGPHIPISPVLPIPSYRYDEYRYPSHSLGFGYSHGYLYPPGIGSPYFDLVPHALPPVDPYVYRGNVIRPNEGPDAYSVARPSMDMNRLADELRVAAERLRQSLASRPGDGDVWLEYLNPEAVIDSLDVTNQADPERQKVLAELASHYEGVAGNPELRHVSIASGFDRTRQLLRIWVERFSEGDAAETPSGSQLDPAVNDRPAEVLPMPDPAADASVAPEPKSRRSR